MLLVYQMIVTTFFLMKLNTTKDIAQKRKSICIYWLNFHLQQPPHNILINYTHIHIVLFCGTIIIKMV